MKTIPQADSIPSMPFVRFRVPNYVLMEQNRPLSPVLLFPIEGGTTTAIYGFSDKGAYDKFIRSSTRELTPYPLVLGFLRNYLNSTEKNLHLVVIDAENAEAPIVSASTVEGVIDAKERCVSQLTSEFRLVFDTVANAYSVESVPTVTC